MEENNFDPMTGAPIQNGAGNNFDPMTGAPIQNGAGNNFDPMTGAPIQNGAGNNFDPMTGAPIQNGAGNNFDPMTGMPVQNMGERSFGANGAAPTPTPTPKKSKKLWAIIAGAVAAVVLIVVIVGIASGAFLGKSGKILMAIKNTFEEQPAFMEDLKLEDISNWLESGKYTINVKADAADALIDVSYSATPSEIQVYGTLEGSGMPETDFLGGLTEEQVRLQLPSVSDVVFVYNYKEEADGILFEDFSEDEIEEVNELLGSFWETGDSDKISEDVSDAFEEFWKGLEIESIDSKEFEIDGKDRKCTGYAITITADEVLDFWDEIETIYEEYELDTDTVKDSLREVRQELRTMPDIEIEIYTYKNELACISLEDADGYTEMEWLFKGGDFRTQNMELSITEYGSSESIVLEGSKDGSTEEYALSYESDDYAYDIGTLEYDQKTGDFTIENDYDEITGNITSSGNSVAITVETVDVEMLISFAKGATLYDIEGEEFDIGTATSEDIMDISEEFEDFYNEMY